MYIGYDNIKIINPNGVVLETITKESANYNDFNDKYDNIEYDKKDFFAIKTNNLTGLKVNSAQDLMKYVQEVISMNEFSELKGPIYSIYCPATNTHYSTTHITGIHRVKLMEKKNYYLIINMIIKLWVN